MKKIITIFCLFLTTTVFAQDSIKTYTVHFQHTLVEQYHPYFSQSPLFRSNEQKTFTNQEESKLSSTTTLFIGKKIGKRGEFYFNPEIAGGEGLSGATGIAGFPNGETFRVGSPKPQFYVARLIFRYLIPLSKEKTFREEDQNILPLMVPKERIAIAFGKFSLSDIFDQNFTSHDPKTSFLNWSLMDAGAWDYPSNTRGYTYALSIKLVKKNYIARLCSSVNSQWSNGPVVTNKEIFASPKDYLRGHGETFEFILPIKKDFTHFIKFTVFANHAPMASYKSATQVLQNNRADTTIIPIDYDNMYGPSSHLVSKALDSMRGKVGRYYDKVGVVISWEKVFYANSYFVRASWNDGQNETWMYTEIDRSLATGVFLNGTHWKRPNDKCRIGFAINDISKAHKDYLLNGGYGFIIGDGFNQITHQTNYVKGFKPEIIFELQYSYDFTKQLIISPDYQFIMNPGYNAARSPVHIFGLRAHFEI